MALLLLLMELRETLGATLRVVHFNHHIRGREADEDEQFVRRFAREAGLACAVHAEDVAAQSRLKGTNLEAEAREQRYAFFHELVSCGWATRIATGHTADDQAETVLARLARGSGLRGLRSIHPVLGPIVRPQIDLRRAELRQYLCEHGKPWREDATNQDTSRLRARIRHGLLPVWEREFGSRAVQNLTRLADMARNDNALIEELVEKRFLSLARRQGNRLDLEVRDILDPFPGLNTRGARQALAARLVRRAAEEVLCDHLGLAASHVASVLELASRGISGQRLDLPGGLMVERVLNRLSFEHQDADTRSPHRVHSYLYSADPWREGDAAVHIAEIGKRLRLKLIDWPPTGRETYRDGFGVLDADRLEPPLVVRNRLPGDSYRPRGRRHPEKLKRLLLERRVAGRDRALWPVLISGGRLVWSSGLPVAADFAAEADTQRAIVIHEESDAPSEGISFRETETAGRASK